MNTKNSKIGKPHKFVLSLSQRLDLRSSNKHIPHQTYLFIVRGKILDNSTKTISSK